MERANSNHAFEQFTHLDRLACSLYEEAREDPGEPVSPIRLVRVLIGKQSIGFVPKRSLPDWAMLTRVNGEHRIFVRKDVPGRELGHTVAHELAHWALRRAGLDDAEPMCDYLAAALVAPIPAFRRALKTYGERLPALARAFRTTQSLVALRWGESTSRPLALVRPGLVRCRGAGFAWPTDRVVRRWARQDHPESLTKARLTDDSRRVVLLARGAS